MAGFPNRPNLLLSSLGPGLSACLLDIFMMDAGPGLRGKVAHAEVDMSNVFCVQPPASFLDGTSSRSRSHSDLVILTVAAFLVLCRRYNPANITEVKNCSFPPNLVSGDSRGHEEGDAGNNSSAPPGGKQTSEPLLSFDEALATCDAHLKVWVPKFHPHELLENDMQACWHEFDRLALTLERRAVSVEQFSPDKGPEGSSTLACMTVVVNNERSAIGSRKAAEIGTGWRQSGDLRLMENGGRPSSKGERKTITPLILTVTDAAHRLMLPVVAGRRENRGETRFSGTGAMGAVKRNQGAGGVLSVAVRVRVALREHTTRLTTRFQRMVGTTAGEGRSERQVHGGSSKPCSGEVSPTAPRLATTQPDCGERGGIGPSPPVDSTAGLSSAFSPYMHSARCIGGISVCQLECLNPTWRTSDDGNMDGSPDHVVGKVASGVRLPAGGKHKVSNTEGGILSGGEWHSEDGSKNRSLFDELVSGAHGNDTNIAFHRGAAGDDDACSTCDNEDGAQKFPFDDVLTSRQGLRMEGQTTARSRTCRQQQDRTPRRISPSTNVINVVSLPQIGCLTGLCRASSDIARGLAARIFELESQMASGTARSGQRRAYAATLMVTPTLLCFLAQTVAAVEAFVLEWDARYSSSGIATVPAGATDIGISGHAPSVNGAQDMENIGFEGSTASSRRGGKGEKGNELIGERRSGGGLRPIHEQLRKQGGTSSSVVADQLTFLRRLAAVIGALGSCVSVVQRQAIGQRNDQDGVRNEEEDTGSSNSSATVMGKMGRKGYIQALTELAVFLETKVAKRGFSGGGSVQIESAVFGNETHSL